LRVSGPMPTEHRRRADRGKHLRPTGGDTRAAKSTRRGGKPAADSHSGPFAAAGATPAAKNGRPNAAKRRRQSCRADAGTDGRSKARSPGRGRPGIRPRRPTRDPEPRPFSGRARTERWPPSIRRATHGWAGNGSCRKRGGQGGWAKGVPPRTVATKGRTPGGQKTRDAAHLVALADAPRVKRGRRTLPCGASCCAGQGPRFPGTPRPGRGGPSSSDGLGTIRRRADGAWDWVPARLLTSRQRGPTRDEGESGRGG